MLKKELVILSSKVDNPKYKDKIYLTFSKTKYKKFKNNYNIEYFFDIDPNINEHHELNILENNLFQESKVINKKWFLLTYKFIYKYLITYNQFYNRLDCYLSKNNNIKSLEFSHKSSFILKFAIDNIAIKYNIKQVTNSNDVDNFSYRHSSYMGIDMPRYIDIDNHDIFIKLYSLYLRTKKHKTFIFPSSIEEKFPSDVNLFRISIFSVFAKVKRLLKSDKNKNYLQHIPLIDFSKKVQSIYMLDRKIWKDYREDQLTLIENIINIFFSNYSYEYIDILKNKIEYFLRKSETQKVILDETVDTFRRLMCITCRKLGIKIEFTPHGMIDEQLQFPLRGNEEYTKKYIPHILAWNNESSKYFSQYKIDSKAISYPISIYPHNPCEKKDILIMLSNGDRINLNAFEEYIINLLPLQTNKKYSIDWKIHHNIFEETNLLMAEQKDFIEKEYNTKFNFIRHDVKVSSILKNYKIIIFTTWTTGIYEAALLNVPFVIYTKANEKIKALDNMKIPIANNISQLFELIDHSDQNYLNKIKESLTNNIKLNSYLKI